MICWLLCRLSIDGGRSGRPFRLIETQGRHEGRIHMTGDASVLGSLHSVDGEGVVRIHVEHLADYISGRELRIDDARWDELFSAYEALGVS